MQKLKVAAVKTIYMSLWKQGLHLHLLYLLAQPQFCHSLPGKPYFTITEQTLCFCSEKAFKYLFQKNVIKAEYVTFLIYLYKDG